MPVIGDIPGSKNSSLITRRIKIINNKLQLT